MNRAIFLSIPEIKLDDIYFTLEAIANSYNEKIFKKYESYYDLLATIFYKYKEGLKGLKNEFYKNFHDVRDLYHLIRIFSSEIIKNNMPEESNIINLLLKKSLLRNLSGLEIEGKSSLQYSIEENFKKDPTEISKIKNIIDLNEIRTMDLIKDNLISKDCRFLLLVSEKSMFGLLVNITIILCELIVRRAYLTN